MVIAGVLYPMLSDDMEGRFEKVRLNKARWNISSPNGGN
jgi:hypothetical protein